MGGKISFHKGAKSPAKGAGNQGKTWGVSSWLGKDIVGERAFLTRGKKFQVWFQGGGRAARSQNKEGG